MGAARNAANNSSAGARNAYGTPDRRRFTEVLAIVFSFPRFGARRWPRPGAASAGDLEAGGLHVVDRGGLHGGERLGEGRGLLRLRGLVEGVVVGVVRDVDVRAVGERLGDLAGLGRDRVEVGLAGEEA